MQGKAKCTLLCSLLVASSGKPPICCQSPCHR